jgi:hypothetical protein
MRAFRLRMALPLLGLLICCSLRAAENPAWNNLKQLIPGQQIRVVLTSNKTAKGQFRSSTDDAITIWSKGAEQTLSRTDVLQVSSRRTGHRGRHVLIGAAIGAGAGLGTGAAIDNDCSPNSIICTGNKGKAILTPVFGLLGAAIGALLPTGGWQEIYRSK